MKEITDPKQRTTCWNCGRRIEMCLCSLVQKFDTNALFFFLVHPKEFRKEKVGSGRISHSSLPNSIFHMGIDFSHDKIVNEIIDDPNNFCVILWPGEESLPITNSYIIEQGQIKRLVVFILDGTWTCARKMYRQSSNLQKIQKVAIYPSAPSIFVIKQQPLENCLSTIEALVYVLKDLEKAGLEKEANWDDILIPFKRMIQQQIEISQDPTRKSYRGKQSYDLEAIKKRAQDGTRKRKLF